jgi:hypothetical protein
MAEETGAFPLIRTKQQRPRLPEDLIPWRRLVLAENVHPFEARAHSPPFAFSANRW